MKSWLISFVSFSFMYFVFLFDKDGAQLGTALFDNVPQGLIQTASIFGNIFWVLGIILLVFGVILLIISVDESNIKKTLKEITGAKRIALFKTNMFVRIFAVASALFAVGSGFWFYGFGWLVAIVGMFVWKNELMKMANKEDEENGVEKPFSAMDLAKSSLLDD